MACMESLPEELIGMILTSCVLNYRGQKNLILPLRLVSQSFNSWLRPLALKTIQLEFSKFLPGKGDNVPCIDAIKDVGEHCQALYCDMMVIRDDEEIERLLTVFQSVVHSVPEMTPLLHSLRQFCMSKHTFDENDYQRVMSGVLALTPNLTRLKLNLPFQVIGKASRTATLLLANTFASLALRSPDHRPLEVLVLDHISDSSLYNICNNPADMKNARDSFAGLKSLTMSIKRQESSSMIQPRFAYFLWYLICHAQKLESLCLIGWNTKRSSTERVEALDRNITLDEWLMKSLPYPRPSEYIEGLKRLRCLELKRVDIDPITFTRMIDEHSSSLKELYLNEVHLKLNVSTADSLWIGHAPEQTRPPNSIWIAEYLRDKASLQLDILRVTSLGYDDFNSRGPSRRVHSYDLDDPSGYARSFDLRFVERAMGLTPPPKRTTPTTTGPEEPIVRDPPSLPRHTYEVEAYQRTSFPYSPKENPFRRQPAFPEIPLTQVQIERRNSCESLLKRDPSHRRDNNTTSQFKSSIDGIFCNHNDRALTELQKIIAVVDRSMNLLSEEIERISREAGSIGE